jgi:hypothetical protein
MLNRVTRSNNQLPLGITDKISETGKNDKYDIILCKFEGGCIRSCPATYHYVLNKMVENG